MAFGRPGVVFQYVPTYLHCELLDLREAFRRVCIFVPVFMVLVTLLRQTCNKSGPPPGPPGPHQPPHPGSHQLLIQPLIKSSLSSSCLSREHLVVSLICMPPNRLSSAIRLVICQHLDLASLVTCIGQPP